MKLLIAGSRSIDAFDLAEHIPPETDLIISGGAAGIDTAAPVWRNEEMVRMADAILVIWDGKSRGTKYTADYAKKQGNPVTGIEV